MIEFKDASIIVGGRRLFDGLSFHVDGGRVVGVGGSRGSGKTVLVEACLGIRPLASGHVTIDGEPLLPSTVPLFRGMMAYVPQQVRMSVARVSDVFDAVCALRSTDGIERPKKRLLAEWKRLGLSSALYEKPLAEVGDATLRLMMLGAAGMLRRSIVLLDSPTCGLGPEQEEAAAGYVRTLAREGAAVLVTSAGPAMSSVCDETLSLDNFKYTCE